MHLNLNFLKFRVLLIKTLCGWQPFKIFVKCQKIYFVNSRTILLCRKSSVQFKITLIPMIIGTRSKDIFYISKNIDYTNIKHAHSSLKLNRFPDRKPNFRLFTEIPFSSFQKLFFLQRTINYEAFPQSTVILE